MWLNMCFQRGTTTVLYCWQWQVAQQYTEDPLLRFRGNNVHADAPKWYVTRGSVVWPRNKSVKSDERPGRPSTTRHEKSVAKVCYFVRNDRRVSICEVDEEEGIFYALCHANWREHLWTRCVLAKQENKKKIVCDAGFVWTCRHGLKFLKYIKTGDETLVYSCNKKGNLQSSMYD
jgi:hypothetical protein